MRFSSKYYLAFSACSLLLCNTLYAEKALNSQLSNKSHYKPLQLLKKLHYIKGEYATGVPFSEEYDKEWIKKFNIVQVGGVNDADISPQILKEKGVLKSMYHIGYDWMPAFYDYKTGTNRPFISYILEHKESMTLNPKGPFIHCQKNGYDWCDDYYYNYFDKDMLHMRVDELIKVAHKKGYNGVFFDWGSTKFLSEPENRDMSQFIATHYPKQSYLTQVKMFYTQLQKKGLFIVTNQAFRDESLLSSVDYDMTESYITTVKKLKKPIILDGKNRTSIDLTRYYPIYANSHSIDDSLSFLNLLDSYKKKYKKDGFKNFIYMNYLAPKYIEISSNSYKSITPKNAIYYGYAMGKLTDSIVYGEVQQNRRLEEDEIYFYDLGNPLGETYQKIDALHGYIRFFEKGFVLVSSAYKTEKYLKISSKYIPHKGSVYDAYNKQWIESNEGNVIVKLKFEKNSFEKNTLPLGRVFLY